MVLFKIMLPRSVPAKTFFRVIFVVLYIYVLACSCSNREQTRDILLPEIPLDMPPGQEAPVLRIMDYKNRSEGIALTPWLRNYLQNGIYESESLAAYGASYLFIASVRSTNLSVIHQWAEFYNVQRDFSRLAARRIQKRLETGLTGTQPDMVYGPYYENTLKEAFGNSYRGAIRRDDSWVYGVSAQDEEAAGNEIPCYWGFILISIPRDTLEAQLNELLAKVSNSSASGSRTATKEQNAAFDYVKEHFFEQF